MIRNAYIDEMTLITIPFSEIDEELSNFTLVNTVTGDVFIINSWSKSVQRWRYELYLENPITFGNRYHVIANEQITFDVKIGQVVRTKAFDRLFFYDKDDLGVTFKKEFTQFKLWAPTATNVEIILEEQNKRSVFELDREGTGVWKVIINKNIEGATYLYRVCVDQNWREAVDPYAKAVTLNGEKGVVVDLSNTNPTGWSKGDKPAFNQPTDAIIYELHIRDFSIDDNSGIKNKGKFEAFLEKNTKEPFGTKTGLDYLVDLGITHVQLLPVQDFGSIDEAKPFEKYNWGYDTVHYNAIEGSYSNDPNQPFLRIKELKKLVKTFHENEIRVILDVVYNHVYVHSKSSFEKIVPGYYFRYYEDGRLADGTGVGNDIASERKMVQKFIVDSIIYFAKEFKVDGFRFDLMGILDIETMKLIRQKLDEIDASILVIGEGWDLATPLHYEKKAIIANADHLPRISFFNDQFRDKLKGNIFDHREQGFCNGNSSLKDDVKILVSGSLKAICENRGMFRDPTQSINYVECHDNHTLWDKLILSNFDQDDAVRKKMHRLATAMTILSQGVPFLHAGQEFFRTKNGEENSYNSPDEINKLDWKRKSFHIENVKFIKGLIVLRKKYDAFRLKTSDEIKKKMFLLDTPVHCLGYLLKTEIGALVVFFNGSQQEKDFILPSSGKWNVMVEGDIAQTNVIRKITGNKVTIAGLSTTVLFQGKVCLSNPSFKNDH